MEEAVKQLTAQVLTGPDWPYALVQLNRDACHVPLPKSWHLSILVEGGTSSATSGRVSQLEVHQLLTLGSQVVYLVGLNLHQFIQFFIACLLILQLKGKMKLFVFLLFVIVAISDDIKFNLELQKNILKFGYSINYKYEGMLAHSFDRFYNIVKFMLPSMGDLNFSNLNFDHSCTNMNKKYTPNTDSSKYLTKLKTYCNKIKPFVSHYSKLMKS